MEIRRTLGELKNLVIDAEQRDESTCYKVPITLTKDEVSRIVRENVAEIILGFAKRLAQDSDTCSDFTSEDWDEFNDNILETFVDVTDFTEATNGDFFVGKLEECVGAVLEDMQVRYFEVNVTVYSRTEVTIPVKAKNEREAREWVDNMPYSDIGDYAENDPEIDNVEIYGVDETDDCYGNYEDAT